MIAALLLFALACHAHVSSVAMTASSTCVVYSSERRVACFGAPSHSQLGGPTRFNDSLCGDCERVLPANAVTVQNVGDVALLVAGNNFYCALLANRVSIRCWGHNAFGQLGQATVGHSLAVDDVRFDFDVVHVRDLSAGHSHVCAVVDTASALGAVACWGNNHDHQLGVPQPHPPANDTMRRLIGTSSLMQRLVPCPPPKPTETPEPTPAPTPEPTPFPSPEPSPAPTPKPSPFPSPPASCLLIETALYPIQTVNLTTKARVLRVFAGTFHTCALTAVGEVFCWGANHWAANGSPIIKSNQSVALDAPPAFDVSLGAQSTCVATFAGQVHCFGVDTGALGVLLDLPPPTDGKVDIDKLQKTISKGTGMPAMPPGAGLPHHLVGSAQKHCFLSKRGSLVCWASVDEAADFDVTQKPGELSTVFQLNDPTTTLVQIAVAQAGHLAPIGALTSSGALRIIGSHRYYVPNPFPYNATYPRRGNNAQANIELPPNVSSGLLAGMSEAPCPAVGGQPRYGRDCLCSDPVPRFATCFNGTVMLRTSLEPGETIALGGQRLRTHATQTLRGAIHMTLPDKYASQPEAGVPWVQVPCAEDRPNLASLTVRLSASVGDLVNGTVVLVLLDGCLQEDAATFPQLVVESRPEQTACFNYTAVGMAKSRRFEAKLGRDECTFWVEMQRAAERNTIIIAVVATVVLLLLALLTGVLLRRWWMRKFSGASRRTTATATTEKDEFLSARVDAPDDSKTSGASRPSEPASSSPSNPSRDSNYDKVQLGDDDDDGDNVNVHVYGASAPTMTTLDIGLQRSSEYGPAKFMDNPYEQAHTKLEA